MGKHSRMSRCSLTTSRTELFDQYECLFPMKNRNAASHVWADHLLRHAESMTSDEFVDQARGFCAVVAMRQSD